MRHYFYIWIFKWLANNISHFTFLALLLFTCSVMSDSLQPHGLQHSRLPCPSLSPGFCSSSCPLSWWCHPTISPSVSPIFFCPQSFWASGSFPMSQHLPKYWRFSFIIRPSNEGFPFIRRLFSFSLFLSLRWYHLHIWGYWYVSIPACDSSSPTFWMTHFTCKLNKQDDNIQPCLIPFPILNQSVVPCTILTVAYWPAYRFLRRQVSCSGIPISLRIFHS